MACPKENMSPRFFSDQFQTENISIKCLGLVEVIDVEGRFDKMLDARVDHKRSGKIKEHHFCGFRSHASSRSIHRCTGSAIACSEGLPIDVHRSSKNLNPGMTTGLQNMGQRLVASQRRQKDPSILVDHQRKSRISFAVPPAAAAAMARERQGPWMRRADRGVGRKVNDAWAVSARRSIKPPRKCRDLPGKRGPGPAHRRGWVPRCSARRQGRAAAGVLTELAGV